MSKKRVLVVAAHPDDESFGCLGTLLKHKEAGATIDFLWFTTGRGQAKGAIKCMKYFDDTGYLHTWPDQELDTFPLKDYITHIEFVLKEFKPHIVYCPFIGDLNRDHRIIAEATMVACRPYKQNAPKEVWMYQIHGSTELGLREFVIDRKTQIDVKQKYNLIKKWYPNEMINGRDSLWNYEMFEKWPR